MYNYEQQKERLFTDEGLRMFLAIRDNVHRLLVQAGAVRLQEAAKEVGGDSWDQLACFDRLVELGELREVTGDDEARRLRVFVSAKR